MSFFLNSKFTEIIEKSANKSLGFLVGVVIFLDILISFIFSFWLFPNHSAGPKFDSQLEAFILVVILSPVIETYIFQTTIIDFIVRKYPSLLLNACLISSIIFGLLHYYSPEYMLKTFISGFLYSILYLVSSKKVKYPFIPVALAHATFNFIGFCIDYFFP
jgi:hypothetical protein